MFAAVARTSRVAPENADAGTLGRLQLPAAIRNLRRDRALEMLPDKSGYRCARGGTTYRKGSQRRQWQYRSRIYYLCIPQVDVQ